MNNHIQNFNESLKSLSAEVDAWEGTDDDVEPIVSQAPTLCESDNFKGKSSSKYEVEFAKDEDDSRTTRIGVRKFQTIIEKLDLVPLVQSHFKRHGYWVHPIGIWAVIDQEKNNMFMGGITLGSHKWMEKHSVSQERFALLNGVPCRSNGFQVDTVQVIKKIIQEAKTAAPTFLPVNEWDEAVLFEIVDLLKYTGGEISDSLTLSLKQNLKTLNPNLKEISQHFAENMYEENIMGTAKPPRENYRISNILESIYSEKTSVYLRSENEEHPNQKQQTIMNSISEFLTTERMDWRGIQKSMEELNDRQHVIHLCANYLNKITNQSDTNKPSLVNPILEKIRLIVTQCSADEIHDVWTKEQWGQRELCGICIGNKSHEGLSAFLKTTRKETGITFSGQDNFKFNGLFPNQKDYHHYLDTVVSKKSQSEKITKLLKNNPELFWPNTHSMMNLLEELKNNPKREAIQAALDERLVEAALLKRKPSMKFPSRF